MDVEIHVAMLRSRFDLSREAIREDDQFERCTSSHTRYLRRRAAVYLKNSSRGNSLDST